ncbi:hypothetical protein [Streptomyces canus]|nr:hypothetical protein [Streptomyces canus]
MDGEEGLDGFGGELPALSFSTLLQNVFEVDSRILVAGVEQ